MNRILYEQNEVSDGVATFGGVRAEHVANILHAEPGGRIKSGVVDGPVGTSLLLEVSPQRVVARVEHDRVSIRPWADVILAPPRPRAFKRLLPQLAALGARNIFLVGAAKVEKDFWGATILEEKNFRPLLIDGLMQSGASILPAIHLRRNFRKFINEELDSLVPPGVARIVAHPYAACVERASCPLPGTDACVERSSRPSPENQTNRSTSAGVCFAIGPEGGWTDGEVETLESRSFERYSLGARILKTETAAIALLARFMAV